MTASILKLPKWDEKTPSPHLDNIREADNLGMERSIGHELTYQLRIFDLPVVCQPVRFAQDHLRAMVQFNWKVFEFPRQCGQKLLGNPQPPQRGVGDQHCQPKCERNAI